MATDTNLSKLTPEEFTNFYMEGLKQELSTYDLQANKVGFLGYLVNMLGNITYDSKVYKDMLFKEAFPATAQQDDNIYLHGSIYGFKNDLATPATAYGTIQFDFSLLPAPSATTTKQEVVFGYINEQNTGQNEFNEIQTPTQINVDNVVFSSKSIYTFVREGNSYKTIVQREDGTMSTYPSNSHIMTVDLDNFKQERSESISFTLPTYNYGSYYTYTFQVQDEFISNIFVYVRMPGDENFIEYNVEKVKYLIDPSANTVFFNQVASDTYQIEFGSGIHGAWIPGAEVHLYLYKTIGVSANFAQNVNATINFPVQMVVKNLRGTEVVNGTTIDPAQYLKIAFKYSEGGVDPLSGEDLRRALVNFIQTRDNFLSESDFYNIVEKYTTDFRFLFKKMVVQNNVFYLQRAFRDEYQNVIRSRNIMPEIINKDSIISGIKFTSIESDSDDGLFPGIYYYKIYAEDKFKNIISSTEITASLMLETAAYGYILLEWNKVPGATNYRIYGRTRDHEFLWNTENNKLYDRGYAPEPDMILDRDSTSVPEPAEDSEKSIEQYPYVIFPDFYTKTGQHFVSPFLYKFNDFYNYYEGWLFYPELIVAFSRVVPSSNSDSFDSTAIPSIYLSIVYNMEKEKTEISLKSYQAFDTKLTFRIKIPELGVIGDDTNGVEMTMVNEYTKLFEYTENHGLILDPVKITIDARNRSTGSPLFTAYTAELNQRYDTTDLLQVPIFKYTGTPYLVDLPVMDYDEFYSDKILYLDKILTFLKGFNFEELRLVSDSLQFRMLNTDSISSYLLSNCLVQGRNLYKDLNYLSNTSIKSISDIPDTIPLNGDSWVILGDTINILSTEVDSANLAQYQNFGDSLTFLTTSPYSIVIEGDYESKFSAADVIRIKDAETSSLNKMYHVLSSKYQNNRTRIYLAEKIEPTINEGTLYYAVYKPWRKGGPDNVARWNESKQIWEFTLLYPNDIIEISKPVHETYRYDSTYNFVDYELKLPLQLSIVIYADRDAVSRYGVNLEDQRKQIKLEVAKYLQLYMSGTDIVYYPSAIVEFIMEPRRIWIKGLVVRTFDSSNPPFEFKNGIETYPEPKIRDNISPSKMEILKYGSAFFWWDVDNIEIKYNMDG